MCDKAVDGFLAALTFVPDWFVANKMIIKLFTLCRQMKIYPTLLKILIMLCFPVMNNICIV